MTDSCKAYKQSELTSTMSNGMPMSFVFNRPFIEKRSVQE